MSKVLLVDDVLEQLMAYQRLLRGQFDILTASDGASALRLLEQDRTIQVIVSDMCMPSMDGIEFLAQSSKIAPEATRIMLTGNLELNSTIEAINRGGIFRFLKKPCSRDDLIEAIEAGLRLHDSLSVGNQARPDPQATSNDAATHPLMGEQHQDPLIQRLQAALHAKTIQAFYQPIVDLRCGTIRSAEALARWRHPADGWIAPIVFIPIAEQYGLMPELGRSMLVEACQQAEIWRRHGFTGSVSVNASPTQFVGRRIIDDVHHALEKSGLPPGQLSLELTESVLIDDPTSIIDILRVLREVGISVAIDDFGTGYSSLAYLKHLPVDRLKIDRCFVMEIDRDARDLKFVRAMIDLAHQLELMVIAEGIERPEQQDILMSLGCELGQGYLFDKALSADAFLNRLTDPSPAELQKVITMNH